jgi:YQGE family putative transporter
MLGAAARRLLWVNGLFALANGLSGLFTGVYLWRLRPGVATLAYYNLWMMATLMFALPLLGIMVKKRGAVVANVLGTVLYAGFYLTLLMLGEQAGNHLAALGMFMGVATASQALAGHVLAYDITDERNREAFYNRSGLVASLAGLIAPLAAGWLLSAFAGLTGYRFIFISSFVLFAVSAWMGLGLHVHSPREPYRLFAVLPGTHRAWHRLLVACGILGLREGIFTFAINLLVYLSAGGAEASLGNFTFVTSLVGLVAFWGAGRVMTRANRGRLFPAGAAAMALACGLLGLGASWGLMLAYGLITAIATPFWSTAFGAASFEIIRQASEGRNLRVEMIAAREIPLNIGRVITLVLFLKAAPEGRGIAFLQVLLAVLGLAFPAAWFFVRDKGAKAPPSAVPGGVQR